MTRHFKLVLVAAVLLLMTVGAGLAYRPAIPGPFAFDDIAEIVDNPSIRVPSLAPANLIRATRVPAWLSPRRPLAYVSLAVSYRLSGLDSRAFRIMNVILLGACGAALLLCGYLFARCWMTSDRALLVASGAALIWTLHPLQTNMVSYIVQRMTSLAILGYLLSFSAFLLALQTRRRIWWLPCGVFGILAMLSKETAYILPASCLLTWAAIPGTAGERWLARPRAGLVVGVAVAAGLAAAALFFAAGYAGKPFTLWERLLTEPRVLWWYAVIFFFPAPSLLNLDLDIPLSRNLLTPIMTMPAIALHAALLGLAVYLWRRRRFLSLILFLYYLHHLVEGTVVPLEIAFEHRMCLPGVFLCLGVSERLLALGGLLGGRRAPAAFAALVLALAAALGAATWARNGVWSSDFSLWSDVAAKSPNKARPHNNLGMHYYLERDLEEAEREFRKALAADPGYGEAMVNLGLVRLDRGDPRGALASMEQALRSGFSDPDLYYNMGFCQERLGRYDQAAASYEKALQAFGGLRDARYRLALLAQRSGKPARALELALEELRLDPKHAPATRLVSDLRRRGTVR